MLDETDIVVLRRLANGDKAALGVLYDRHAAMLLALGLRIVRSRREAEDPSEIATQLGIPIGTVKSRVSATMQTLRKALGVTCGRPKEAS